MNHILASECNLEIMFMPSDNADTSSLSVTMIVVMIMIVMISIFFIPRMSLPNTLPWISLPSHPSRIRSNILFQLCTSSLLPAFLARNHSPVLFRSTRPIFCTVFDAEAGPSHRKDLFVHRKIRDEIFFLQLGDEFRQECYELWTILLISGKDRFQGLDLAQTVVGCIDSFGIRAAQLAFACEPKVFLDGSDPSSEGAFFKPVWYN